MTDRSPNEQPGELFTTAIMAKAGVCDDERHVFTKEVLCEAAEANLALWYKENDQTLRHRLELEFVPELVPYWLLNFVDSSEEME